MSIKVSTSEARKSLNELVNRAHYSDERIILTRHNRPAAVLIGLDDYQKLLEIGKTHHKYDFSEVSGKLQWVGDALIEQQKLRDEW